MTTQYIKNFVAIASNELLRSIIVSQKPKDRPFKFYAKLELARRDRIVTFAQFAA